jgi:hypothetical protein
VEAQRSIAAEVVEVLATAVPAMDDGIPQDLDDEFAHLATLDDAALRRAARSRLAVRESRRLESLHFELQSEGLTDAERAEEQRLIRAYRRALLIRAQALALLKQRGRDIAPLLDKG